MVKMIDNYTLLQVIGQGNYGKVYRGKNIKNNQQYAIKIIPSQKLHQNNKLQQCTMNQIQTLTMIGQTDHIVRYYQMLKTKNNYYFVYEFCNGGTLMQLLQKNHYLDEKNACSIFKQLLEAFKVLNRYNIMHRDLKPENIFFTDQRVKLGDFGFCKGLKPDQNMTKTMLGSPIYMAPEVLKGQPYNTKADIWSLGVILYQMLYGVCPFQSSSIAMLITTINNQDIGLPQDPKVSQKTQQLIKKMLTKDYFRRIGWVQLFGWKFDDQASDPKNSISYNQNQQNQNQFVEKKSSYLEQWSQRNKLNQINIKDAKDRSVSQDIARSDKKEYLQPSSEMGSLGNITSTNMILTPTMKRQQEAPSLKHINFNAEHKSFSAIKQPSPQIQLPHSDPKKPASLPKRQPANNINTVYGVSSAYRPSVDSSKKIFYSQNYKDIFSTPLGDKNQKQEDKLRQRRQSFTKENRLDLSAQERYDKKQNQNRERMSMNMYSSANTASRMSALTAKNIKDRTNAEALKQKRKSLLSVHEQCLLILRLVCEKLQQKRQKYMKIGFLVLGKILQKLRSITALVNIAQIDLLDVASLINYQIIMVDRMMIDIKQQLNNSQDDIPKKQEFQNLAIQSQKIKQFFYSQSDILAISLNISVSSPKLKSQTSNIQKVKRQNLELAPSSSFQLEQSKYKFNSPNNVNVGEVNQRSGSFSRYNKSTYNTVNGEAYSDFYQNYMNNKQKQGVAQN